MNETRPGVTAQVAVHTVVNGAAAGGFDTLAVEEPLEIRVSAAGSTQSIGVTMRTPGNDFELAAGFLFAEGLVKTPAGIREISYCLDGEQRYNVVTVELTASKVPQTQTFARRFAISSSCGVCGRATIEDLQTRAAPLKDKTRVSSGTITALPERMQKGQRVFERTGGLHAAALFDSDGNLVSLREDVGRHNALDKLIGWALLNGRVPLSGHIVLVSGRASYELVQKSVVVGIPILCAVSAPSSLAADLAHAFNVTLAGFVRGGRFNIYAAQERIAPTAE